MIEYILSLLVLISIWSLLTQSYNLSFGLTGLFNLGHIIFYGIGAYAAAILNIEFGSPFLLNLLLGGVIAAVFSAVLGLLTLRLSGHYLAIATLGAAMISIVVATNWINLTNGPLGIRGIKNPSIFGISFDETWSILLLYSVVAALGHYALYKLFHSPFGRLQKAIDADDIGAQSLGKNTFSAKVWSLSLSAFFCGYGGSNVHALSFVFGPICVFSA